MIRPIGIHPKYPFLYIFRIPYSLSFGIPKEVLPFLWYLYHLHTIIIEFLAPSLHIALRAHSSNPTNTTHLHTFLSWFKPVPEWLRILLTYPITPCFYILFSKPFTKDGFKPFSTIHMGTPFSIYNSHFQHLSVYKAILSSLCLLNKVDISENDFPLF